MELSKYLFSNKLAGLLGLEVPDDTLSARPQMLEFVLAGEVMVMVKEEEVTRANVYSVMGWPCTQDEEDIVSITGHEMHK